MSGEIRKRKKVYNMPSQEHTVQVQGGEKL